VRAPTVHDLQEFHPCCLPLNSPEILANLTALQLEPTTAAQILAAVLAPLLRSSDSGPAGLPRASLLRLKFEKFAMIPTRSYHRAIGLPRGTLTRISSNFKTRPLRRGQNT